MHQHDRQRGNFRSFSIRYRKWGSIALLALLLTLCLTALDLPIARQAVTLAAPANTWVNFSSYTTGTTPDARTRMISVWDPVNNQMIIHGGFSDGGVLSRNDTWKLNPQTGTWTKFADPPADLPTRVNGCGVWDTRHNQMLIFGGHNYVGANSTLADIWSFDPNGSGGTGTWKQFTPTGSSPGAREGLACGWDQVNYKMVVYGGGSQDVFAFDPGADTTGTWTQLTSRSNYCGTADPVSGPGNRVFTTYVWNPVLNRLLIWGGRNGCSGPTTYFTDTWSFDPNGYTTNSGILTQLNTPGPVPAARDRAAMVWDSSINQMVIFGSANTATNVAYNDVWAFNQTSATDGHWTLLDPQGTLPYARVDDGAVYDPIRNQTLYFGGFYYSSPGVETRINELWGRGAAPAINQPSKLGFTRNIPDTLVSTAFNPQPQVAVQDFYGTTVSGANPTAVTLAIVPNTGAAGASLSSSNPVNTASGVATFSGLSINLASATPYQLRATASGLTSADSNTFIISNGSCPVNSPIVVNTLDDGAGDSCLVTLRYAITNAPQGATINFGSNLLNTNGTGALQTLQVNSANGIWPTPAAGVKIVAPCVTVSGNRGRPSIALDGSQAGTNTSGFTLSNGNSPTTGNTISGLAILNFSDYGIKINNSAGNTIACNYIGTDDGTTPKPNQKGGIYISGGGAGQSNLDNFIGISGDSTSGNLISGNGGAGIQAIGAGAKISLFYNYIGYKADGTSRFANGGGDLKISGQAHVAVRQGNKLK